MGYMEHGGTSLQDPSLSLAYTYLHLRMTFKPVFSLDILSRRGLLLGHEQMLKKTLWGWGGHKQEEISVGHRPHPGARSQQPTPPPPPFSQIVEAITDMVTSFWQSDSTIGQRSGVLCGEHAGRSGGTCSQGRPNALQA